MAAKKNLITDDLIWARAQLATWKQYIDANPFHEMTDRTETRVGKGGATSVFVISKIEEQIKSVRETMKDYLSLLEVVKKLEIDEEKKQDAAKGNVEIPSRMKRDGS